MNWRPAFAIVLLYVTLVTYRGALAFERYKLHKKALGWLFALLSLAPLVVFKYYNFINESIAAGLEYAGLHFALPGLNWAIPVGLSFFTFQAYGYLFDVYRGQFEAEKSMLDYSLFVAFFPQIAAGPISKANELLPQIKHPASFDYDCAKQGLKYLLWGMFIKVVLADRLGLFVDTVYANYQNYNGTTCFVASVFYSIQIYGDFAGYSLMAIGVARVLGFDLINNFRRPYLAVSITDFWKRWHISLTRWLTQNIYIPLGGNRCSKLRCYFNIFITFIVSGIWHGAAWNFILWGGVHGIAQITEKHLNMATYPGHNLVIKWGRMVLTFLIVNFAWILFRAPDIATAFSYIGRIFTSFGLPDFAGVGISGIFISAMALTILIFKECREEFFPNSLPVLKTKIARWTIYVGLFCSILLLGMLDGGQFIYVSF